MLSAECMTMKLELIDREDPNTLKMSTAVSWKWMEEVAYEESMVLVFKHPTDSSIAAITSIEDLDLSKKNNTQFPSYEFAEIPKDVRYKMDYQDVELYDQAQRELKLNQEWS